MADRDDKDVDDEDLADGEEGEEGEGKAKKKLSPIKLAIFAGVPVLLIAAGVAAAFFLGFIGGKSGDDALHAEDEHVVAPDQVAFYDLPEILVNLNTGGKSETFMKLSLAIEIPKDAPVAEIDLALPRIMDRFQVFLRELRHEDLDGSAGTYRLKQELLRRVRKAGISYEINDVLIREMIIQ